MANSKMLTILLYDIENDTAQLFKSLATINNQVGLRLEEEVQVILLSNQMTASYEDLESYFPNLKLMFECHDGWSLAKLLNLGLTNIVTPWMTILDSRDLLFADGTLLDFFKLIWSPETKADVIVFKYVYPEFDKQHKVTSFGRADFLNMPFGKYWKRDFLAEQQLGFNEKLDQYVLTDFTSRAMEICPNPLWVDLNNYYLVPRPQIKQNVTEFITYRIDFLNFISYHQVTNEIYLRDLVWSIVHAWNLLVDLGYTNDSHKMGNFSQLLILIRSFGNYKAILNEECRQQGIEFEIPYDQLKKGW
ncbi:hypothetical protein [Lactiplantibacillus plantarum]|uniref:hypothetical protein n=1 Tax=Lactiplantibacillus plantarum TaxID=1590 RepID=UPI0020010277|nr:hypothetical protein [Lactiplantibacillus plantarum]